MSESFGKGCTLLRQGKKNTKITIGLNFSRQVQKFKRCSLGVAPRPAAQGSAEALKGLAQTLQEQREKKRQKEKTLTRSRKMKLQMSNVSQITLDREKKHNTHKERNFLQGLLVACLLVQNLVLKALGSRCWARTLSKSPWLFAQGFLMPTLL